MVVSDTPVRRAISRAVQWLRPGSGGLSVSATTSALLRAEMLGGRPDRGRSASPVTPCSANRRRKRKMPIANNDTISANRSSGGN